MGYQYNGCFCLFLCDDFRMEGQQKILMGIPIFTHASISCHCEERSNRMGKVVLQSSRLPRYRSQ
jgi:hypothetical protein